MNSERFGKNCGLKRIKSFIKILLLIVLAFALFPALAKYLSTASGNSDINIAKWSIVINGETITNSTNQLSNSINLLNSADDTTNIDAGDECYFDLVINPSTTEVSIEYSISVDVLAQTCTLPQGTVIEKYEKYSGSSNTFISSTNVNDTDVTISENILLSNRQPLGNSDIRKYRIFFTIPNYLDVVQGQEYKIIPEITVRQYI